MNPSLQESARTALRFLRTRKATGGDLVAAEAFTKAQRWMDRAEILSTMKGAGLEQGAVGTNNVVDFAREVVSASIVGRIPGARRLPARRSLLAPLVRPRGYIRVEGQAVPSVGAYGRIEIVPVSVMALIVASNEALDDPLVENALAADLADAVRLEADAAFAIALDAAATTVDASVTSLAELDAALVAAMKGLDLVAGLRDAAWILPGWLAGRLSLLRGTGGSPSYPLIGALGGTIAGLPALTFDDADVDSDFSGSLRLVSGPLLGYDEGTVEVDMSSQATIEMGAAPVGDSLQPTASSATPVHLFSADSSAIRATMRAGWVARRAGAVQLISGITL